MKDISLAQIRQNYTKSSLSIDSCDDNPISQFKKWIDAAIDAQVNEPTAMTLATSQPNGRCSARIVLLKYFDENGFYFFTNYSSAKADDLSQNNNAALLFFWPELEQQIRIEGSVSKSESKLSDEYFYLRPFESRISAIISPQSKEITSREELEKQIDEFRSSDRPVQRPDYWGGYHFKAHWFEFWQGRANRLHDRIVYEISNDSWKKKIVAP